MGVKSWLGLQGSCVIAGAVITEEHRLGGLNNRNVFPHSSGG